MDPTGLGENGMSRRYLRLVLRWVPVAMQWYNDWPVRPNCAHFLGGVLWYGQETAMPIAALAVAAASAEYDEALAGMSADELRRICWKGLRYLCFTHDTGPEDCVRPAEGWGRKEPAGTKWGERGRGFFPESQCGRTIANLALTAALIRDLVGDEERAMLRAIAEDYMQRFEDVPPRSGVYWDTQTEENAWTAEGIAACICLLPGHPRVEEWFEALKLWAFRAVTTPDDARDTRPFADGRTVAELCGRTFTTHPDGTAENHAIVHPSYMASSIALAGWTATLLELHGHPVPPHLRWRRDRTYEVLKSWADETGAFHCPQGMDWPYIGYQAQAYVHAVANLWYEDADAALLERRALEVIEHASEAHGGRMLPELTTRHCHGQQDPAIMRERMVHSLAGACLLHRVRGEGCDPADLEDFRGRQRGVRVYPHGGAVLHRHERGINSFAWRNCTMVLPMARDGLRWIGPASNSVLGTLKVAGRHDVRQQVMVKVRDRADRVCALLVEDVGGGAVRRRAFFASLPDGRCLTFERLTALEDVAVEHVRQGYLCVMNDPYFSDAPDHRARLTLRWAEGEREVVGYAAADDADEVCIDLSGAGWVNVDGRLGVVFRGTGHATYRNRHHWDVWHAVGDDLVLSECEEAFEARAGETIGELTALWAPRQSAQETARTVLAIGGAGDDLFWAQVGDYLCACNFGGRPAALPGTFWPGACERLEAGAVLAAAAGELKLEVSAHEPVIVEKGVKGERG